MSVFWKDIIIFNAYAPNKKASNCGAKTDKTAKSNTWIHYHIGDINTTLLDINT